MKIFFMHINIIAVAVMIISGLCLESDIALKLFVISTAYIALYTFRRELMRGVYKVICFYLDAFRSAGGKR